MKLRRTNIKGKSDKQMKLDDLGRGNPFTTPPGYFDSMSSDIMKTVGTVSILALFRLKPLQIAIGVVTTMAVATAIYFFASDKSSASDDKKIVPQSKQIMPDVILRENANQPISLLTYDDLNKPDVIMIDPDANPQSVMNYMNQLPLSDKLRSYLTDEYSLLIAANQPVSDSDFETNQTNSETEQSDTWIYTPIISTDNSGNPTRILSAFELLPRDTCSENSMIINAAFPGINNYKWSTGASTPEIEVSKTGTYRVTVTLENNKILSKSVSVKVIPRPNLSSDYLVTACAGSSLRLSVGQKTGGYQYYWPQYKVSAPQMTVSRPGLYYANVTGCQTYVDSFFVVYTHCELGIPNMVSPNGDGIQETFAITNLHRYPNTELQIFDRRNQLVFKSVNYQNDWDASSTPDGSYFYILKFTDGTTQDGLITVKH